MAADYVVIVNQEEFISNEPLYGEGTYTALAHDTERLIQAKELITVDLGQFYGSNTSCPANGGGGDTRPTTGQLYPRGFS